MNPVLRAILAVALMLSLGASDPEVDDVVPPQRVAFRLADNVRLTGELTRWDDDGFDGSFGRRRWIELNPDDAFRLFRRLMDEHRAADWVRIGRMLLLHEGQEERADDAFARAARLDPEAEALVEQARREVQEIRTAERAREAARRDLALITQSPEAAAWPSDPWPEMSQAERKAARLSLFADAEQLLADAGLIIEPVEADFVILYSDAPRTEAARWAVNLDKRYRSLLKTLGLPDDANLFWGKLVVILLTDQDRFRLLQATSFNQLVPLETTAITQFRGPKAITTGYKRADTTMLEAALAHELVHAAMHRFISPKRLPAWANEGLAELFAQRVIDDSPIHEGRRAEALRLIRGGYPVAGILDQQYDDATFPGPRAEGYSVGHLFVEFLLNRGQESFNAWVRDVKSGADWRTAMEKHFGASPGAIMEAFVRFHRVND